MYLTMVTLPHMHTRRLQAQRLRCFEPWLRCCHHHVPLLPASVQSTGSRHEAAMKAASRQCGCWATLWHYGHPRRYAAMCRDMLHAGRTTGTLLCARCVCVCVCVAVHFLLWQLLLCMLVQFVLHALVQGR
jgi:hypothetical protein